MKPVVQQLKRWGCGQACVAMALDLTFEEAVSLVGKGRTTGVRLCKALAGRFPQARLVVGSNPPATAIARVRWKHAPGHSHWVYFHEGALHDPSEHLHDAETVKWIQGCWHFVSYISLEEENR